MKNAALILIATLYAGALSACTGANVPTGIENPNGGTPSIARRLGPYRPDLRRSTIAPKADEKRPLLFVSDAATAEVYLYNMSTLQVDGTVTGLTYPQGECSNTKGDVWVTDTGARAVYKLSHLGRLENTIASSGAYPVGCAWEPATGDVAVTNLFGGSGSRGGVAIYTKGTGEAHWHVNPKQYYYNFAGYDAGGNLFVDGRDKKGTFVLSELPKGAKSAYTIALSGGTIYFPGMVQWDSTKNDLIVGDQSCGNAYASCLHSVSISGTSGTITSTIDLQNAGGGQVCDLVQGVMYNGQLAGSDDDICGSAPSTTYLWPYPAGGAPSQYNDTVDSTPIGAAVSPGASALPLAAQPGSKAQLSTQDLIYVTNQNSEVTVYNFATHKLLGVLTHFTTPMGECVDASGNVYIADAGAEKIFEYAHGGSKAIKTLDDSPDSPHACSVDPTTGNLAVANDDGESSQGNVAIWPDAGGQPTRYTDSALYNFNALAYDGSGNLLTTGGTAFAWLPRGGSALVNLTIPGPKRNGVSGIQWDGRFFALDDGATIYRVALIHGLAYYIGSITLQVEGGGPYCIVKAPSKSQSAQIVGATYSQSDGNAIESFDYPGGDGPLFDITHGLDGPFGVAVSPKTQ